MEEKSTEGNCLELVKEPSKKEKVRRWIFSDLARIGVWCALGLSLGIFAVYTAGSMPDPGFSDRRLFFLLRLLRYSSLVSTAFSLFSLGFSVRRLVYRPGLRNALAVFLYFITGLISASLAMLNSLIIAATGGNI